MNNTVRSFHQPYQVFLAEGPKHGMHAQDGASDIKTLGLPVPAAEPYVDNRRVPPQHQAQEQGGALQSQKLEIDTISDTPESAASGLAAVDACTELCPIAGTSCSARKHQKSQGSHRQRRGKDDHDRLAQRQSKSRSNPTNAGLTFACPFYLQSKYNHQNCLRYTITRVGDVRQHIKRCHVQPSFCPRCNLVFEGDNSYEQRDAHIKQWCCRPAEYVVRPSGATPEQMRLLEDPANRKPIQNIRTPMEKEYGRWYAIWDIMFPGAEHPASPRINIENEHCNLGAFAAVRQYKQNGGVQAFLRLMDLNINGEVLHHFLDHFLHYDHSPGSVVNVNGRQAIRGGMMRVAGLGRPSDSRPLDLLPRLAQSNSAYTGAALQDHGPNPGINGGLGYDNDSYVVDDDY
ncbi:hypothetical protein F5Y14DRAFT_462511 [Nemania sp. NC0429]|nr:hypothetical protein F5Y14DRAFT_462511 [Nemania sp. NC0429]